MSDKPSKPSSCEGCPSLDKTCITQGNWVPNARITVVIESPSSWATMSSIKSDKNYKLLASLMRALEQKTGKSLPFSAVFASGSEGKPSTEVIDSCAQLWKHQWSGHYGQQIGPHVIVPFGLPASKGAGVTGKKIMDVRGRIQQRTIGTRAVHIVPTLSLASLYVKPGLAEVVQQDLLRAVKTAYLDEYVAPMSIAEASKDYIMPRTLEEVRAVCDKIIEYYDPEKQSSPWAWPIAVDLETNTLKAFRKDAKILMISFGWDDGKATAILLNHPLNTWYDPALAWKEVQRVLESPKPKVFHNFKFDGSFLENIKGIKVNNVMWDTMCGQHWISEDQKGVYGLKALAPTYAPQYEGYEEKLHDALRQGEEAAPTEEDVLQEARELSAASGDDVDTSWIEGGFEDVEAEEEAAAAPLSNDQWLVEPAWPDSATDEQKLAYLKARDDWFTSDGADDGKNRGIAMRAWKKLAKKLGLPKPDPATQKDIKAQLSEWEAVSLDTLMPYAAADADVTRIIFKKQWYRLRLFDMVDQAKKVMDELYIPGSRALGALEFRGAKVDLDLAEKYDRELNDVILAQQESVQSLAMRHFNINASRQLAEVLVSLGFKNQGETKGGQMKTSKDVLVIYQDEMVRALSKPDLSPEDLAHSERRLMFIEALLLYRAGLKMKQSFLRSLREYSALDGHIHTTFHLTGTSTGRLSCVDGGTLVDTNGGLRRIDTLVPSPGLMVRTHENRYRQVEALIRKGDEEMFEVEMDSGASVTCTGAHRVLTPTGWRRVDELGEGDTVVECPAAGQVT